MHGDCNSILRAPPVGSFVSLGIEIGGLEGILNLWITTRKRSEESLLPAVYLAPTPMNQIVPYVPPQPSDPLMEKISRLEREVNKLSGDKYDVADLDNLSLYPKVRLPYGFKWPEIDKYNGTGCITK